MDRENASTSAHTVSFSLDDNVAKVAFPLASGAASVGIFIVWESQADRPIASRTPRDLTLLACRPIRSHALIAGPEPTTGGTRRDPATRKRGLSKELSLVKPEISCKDRTGKCRIENHINVDVGVGSNDRSRK